MSRAYEEGGICALFGGLSRVGKGLSPRIHSIDRIKRKIDTLTQRTNNITDPKLSRKNIESNTESLVQTLELESISLIAQKVTIHKIQAIKRPPGQIKFKNRRNNT